MSSGLILAIVTITLALVFYTIGVWSERKAGILKWSHVSAFGLGLFFDMTGTFLMSQLSGKGAISDSPLTSLMAISGGAALLLMAVHLLWAVIVKMRNRENELVSFHKYSVAVWTFWLIPYVTGAAAAMM